MHPQKLSVSPSLLSLMNKAGCAQYRLLFLSRGMFPVCDECGRGPVVMSAGCTPLVMSYFTVALRPRKNSLTSWSSQEKYGGTRGGERGKNS